MRSAAWANDHNAISVESQIFHYPLHLTDFCVFWSHLYVELPDIRSVCPLDVSVELPVFCERQDLDP